MGLVCDQYRSLPPDLKRPLMPYSLVYILTNWLQRLCLILVVLCYRLSTAKESYDWQKLAKADTLIE